MTRLLSRASWSNDKIDRMVVQFGRLVLIAAMVITMTVGVLGIIPRLFGFVAPPLYDYNLLHLDEILTGGHPVFLVAHFAVIHPTVLSFLRTVYAGLSWALALMFLLAVYYPHRIHPVSAFVFTLGTACAGGAMYALCPAGGPIVCAHSLGVANFPMADMTAVSSRTIPCPAGAPFNATPSLHFAWAMLVFLALRPFGRWMAIVTGAFAVLTAISTLAIGEHYAVDLIASLPFTLAIYGLANRRYAAASVGGATIIAWQLCVRFLPVAGAAFVILAPAALLCGVHLFGKIRPSTQSVASRSRKTLGQPAEAMHRP
ncbi:MAG: phosphatase PAP2 family protein [Bryobacteraceae bacterium]